MTGTVEHEGRIYSIRHMGGDMQAIVEMAEERMPPEHASMTSRMRHRSEDVIGNPTSCQARVAIQLAVKPEF